LENDVGGGSGVKRSVKRRRRRMAGNGRGKVEEANGMEEEIT